MKNIQKFWVHGRTLLVQGLGSTLKHASLALILVTLSVPISIKAAQGITQLEYIQWLVQASGESGQFTLSSSASDYVQWAQSKGILPAGGWKPTAALTRQVLAQTLVQLLNLSSSQKDSADYERILRREGFDLPVADDIDRPAILNVLNLSPIPIPNTSAGSIAKRPNNGLGNGDQPPPPHNPNGNPHNSPPGNSGNAPGH